MHLVNKAQREYQLSANINQKKKKKTAHSKAEARPQRILITYLRATEATAVSGGNLAGSVNGDCDFVASGVVVEGRL